MGVKRTHKIDIVKTLAINISSGNDTSKVVGFKAHQKENIRFHHIFQTFGILMIFVRIFVGILKLIGTSLIKTKK